MLRPSWQNTCVSMSGLCSVPLVCWSLLETVSHYLDYCSFILHFEINPPNLLFFNIDLVILDLYTFTYILVLICQFLLKKILRFWLGLLSIYRSIRGVFISIMFANFSRSVIIIDFNSVFIT